MKTNSRHKIVDGLVCKRCGEIFSARKQRVDAGLAIFCSRKCASFWQAEQKGKKYVGKENGKVTFDSSRNNYYVYWFEPDTLKRKTTSYAHWWWEINKGEIPEGYRASYKDGNSMNIEPENIILISSEEFGRAISDRLMGHPVEDETRKKIAIAHTGASTWNGFINDNRYPNFSKHLKQFIKERDGVECKVCGCDLKGSIRSRIHHIDGDKKNANPDNLVLVCLSCHSLIHSKKVVNETLLAFRSKLG